MPGDRSPIKHQMKIYGPAALLVIVAFVVAFQFIKPAPPDRIVMATGGVDGAYHRFASRYAEILAREGITLELRPTAGAVENIELLRAGEVSLAMVQSGVGDVESAPGLTSLGSVYYEPLWLFHRKDLELRRLGDLAGRWLAIGPEGSGTRALVTGLLKDNGLENGGAWLGLGGQEALEALLGGGVDAAFFVISAESELASRMLRHPEIMAMDFARADAYTRRYPFLNSVELPEGVVDLALNIPDRNVRLLAPAANLVSEPDLHPALIDLLLQAASEVHGTGGWLEGRDEFPVPEMLAFPLNKEAGRYYKSGPPFLQRYLPFWAASLVDRLKVLLLPFLVLLFPLFKIMPPIYSWRMRARIYRWYGELEQAEEKFAAGRVPLAEIHEQLDRVELEVQHVKVPLSFTNQLYHLRQHIDLVRNRIAARE